MSLKIKYYAKNAGILAVLAVFAFYVYRCPFRLIFGVPCPGCNFTSASIALLQGDFSRSFYLHAMVLPTIAAALLWLFSKKRKTKMTIVYIWAASMLIYYLWRMIVIFPDAPMNMASDSLMVHLGFFR